MSLLAPNGRPSKLTPEQYRVVRTDAFKKWFGDWEKLAIEKMKDPAMDDVTLGKLSDNVSKVLDENGEPLVVYHTVKEEYKGWTKFKTVNDGNEIGSHFGTLEQAQHVAKNSRVDNPKMFLCFLSIKNPLKVDDMGFWTADNFKLIFNKNKIAYQESGNFYGAKYIEVQDVYDALASKNIDGLMYRNIYEGSGFSYSVFYPNQIKLADGTNTTFDGSNADIQYNNGGKMKSVSNGTITVGASHDEGGIPVYNKGTGQMLEVEGGEGIINKRSMALKKEITLNGEKMTPCEAASEINQMAGGVAYNCDNAKSSKETYDNGGEFQKGLGAEQEHKATLEKLYSHSLTPDIAVQKIVKEHLRENPKYYTEMNRKYTPSRKKAAKCDCAKRYYDGGGEFDSGIGSLDSFVNSKTPTGLKNAEDQEIIDYTITTGREMLDTDILPIILKNIDAKWKPYFATYKTFNLYKLGWRIQFGSSRQWAGLCSWDGEISKNIYVSIQFVKHDRNWKDNAIDTIQHEIAHACVTEAIIMKVGQPAFKMIDPLYFANTGHGESWKSICNAINPDGDCSVFYSNAKMKESFRPYKYECVNCGNKGYGNKLGFTSNCFKCFRPVITSKNLV